MESLEEIKQLIKKWGATGRWSIGWEASKEVLSAQNPKDLNDALEKWLEDRFEPERKHIEETKLGRFVELVKSVLKEDGTINEQKLEELRSEVIHAENLAEGLEAVKRGDKDAPAEAVELYKQRMERADIERMRQEENWGR